MTTKEWATKYRFLSSIEAARPGKYVLDVTPPLAWPNGPLDAIDNPAVREVWCQKSAQVAWTSGVLGNAIGRKIDLDPSPILMLFPREQSAKDYMAEKFEPMVEATPRLRDKIDLRSRKAQQRQLFKRFLGGFLKLVGSNSPSSVKSTPAPWVIVEEPDDCNLNTRNQGDSITLARERLKTYTRSKLIAGGTPTVESISSVAAGMETTDKCVGMVPCPDCGEEQVLSFDNFRCQEDETRKHPVFGHKLPDTAYYACTHCGAHWNDAKKNRALRHGRWQATAEFRGKAGFYLNELYSTFPGSTFAILMEKWLTAQHEAEQGDPGKLIAFTNSSMGICYALKRTGPDETSLSSRALDYPAMSIPVGGLILTIGVDVQHDRLELVIRAYGRRQESWLVLYERLPGNPRLIEDPVWADLDRLIFARFQHARGWRLAVKAVSIDSSDGTTSDAVYQYVRTRKNRGVQIMAIKGSTVAGDEIFTAPRKVMDTNKNNTKAAKFGIRPYIVGVSKAKDLLIGDGGRVSLEGTGPGRFHVYKEVNPDYYEQLLSEIKAPIRSRTGTVTYRWVKQTGRRNEALDCEVYALHASRAAKVHLMQEAHWQQIENELAQAPLFEEPEPEPPAPPPQATTPSPAPAGLATSDARSGGDWIEDRDSWL